LRRDRLEEDADKSPESADHDSLLRNTGGSSTRISNSARSEVRMDEPVSPITPRNGASPRSVTGSTMSSNKPSSARSTAMLSQTPFHYFSKSKCAFALKDYANAKQDAIYALELMNHQAKHSIMSQLRTEYKQQKLEKKRQLEKQRQKKFFITATQVADDTNIEDNDESDSRSGSASLSKKKKLTSDDDEQEASPNDMSIRLLIGVSCYFLKEYSEALQYLSNVVHYYRPPRPDDDMEQGPSTSALQEQEQFIMFAMSKNKKSKGVSIYDENDFSYSEERVNYATEKPLFRFGGKSETDKKNGEVQLDSISAQEYERALLFRSKTYSATARFTDAIVDMNRLVAAHPKSVFLLRLRGILKRESRKFASAIDDFEFALKLKKSGDYKVYTARGQTYLAMELLEEALQDFQASLHLQPQYAPTWKYLGRTYTLMKQFEKAEEALTRTVNLDDDDKEACKLLGDVCKHLGMLSRAKLYYHKALLLDHSYKTAVHSLNEMLELSGKTPISPMKLRQPNKHNKHKTVMDRSSVRLSLLFGNSKYSQNALRTPETDVIALHSTLFDLGFTSNALRNATKEEIMHSVHSLCAQRRHLMSQKVNEGKTSIVFFYFNGHAFQHANQNYLVPVDFQWRDHETMDEMLAACVSVNLVMRLIEDSDPQGVNVYIFDSMRPHSLTRTREEEEAWILEEKRAKAAAVISNVAPRSQKPSFQSPEGTSKRKMTVVPKVSTSADALGMAPVTLLGEESIVGFSHEPNTAAYDQGFNMGIFTRVLIEHLHMDSLFLDLTGMEHNRALLFKVKQRVREESFGKIESWFSSSLSQSVILNKKQN